MYSGVRIMGQEVQVSTMLKIKLLQELKFTNPGLQRVVLFMCSPGLLTGAEVNLSPAGVLRSFQHTPLLAEQNEDTSLGGLGEKQKLKELMQNGSFNPTMFILMYEQFAFYFLIYLHLFLQRKKCTFPYRGIELVL